MNKNKLIGFLIALIGFFVLFYKRSGFYGWDGYVDKSLENIIISSILIVTGLLIMKKRKLLNNIENAIPN